jgi:hypothetical protein
MSPTTPLEDLVASSEFIFQGKVDRLGAGTMPVVPANRSTGVVKVEKVLRRPPGLADFVGKSITVQFASRAKPRAKQRFMIFADGWLYGTSIAVKENGHVVADPSLPKKIADIAEASLERALRDRVARSQVIVSGRVEAVTVLPVHTEPGLPEPEWAEVALEISSVEKGPKRELPRMVCPARPTPDFPHAPVLRRGQEGIWILHRAKIKGIEGRLVIALDQLDFQPPERLELIRRLVRRER